MTAPLRIVDRGPPGVAAEPGPASEWIERLVKLVPAEILAVYLAGRPHAEAIHGAWPLVCLGLLLAVRAWGTHEPGRGPQWPAIGISAVSFLIWVLAVDGRILGLRLDADVAALALLVWTTLVPALYRGERRR
jgi:hypothetical protein